jgi:hypothetical protein
VKESKLYISIEFNIEFTTRFSIAIICSNIKKARRKGRKRRGRITKEFKGKNNRPHF